MVENKEAVVSFVSHNEFVKLQAEVEMLRN